MKEIFHRIYKTVYTNIDKIKHEDILSALTEELGEYSKAKRVERKAVICHNESVKEPAKIEIVDLILVCLEAFILEDGTYNDMLKIVKNKLDKWEKLWEEANEGDNHV